MKKALTEFSEIRAAIAKRDFALMLDFDGVLAPIVENPHTARMTSMTRALVKKIAHVHPVAVVSGRSLADIRRRIGMPHVWYVGNHGAEWSLGTVSGTYQATPKEVRSFRLVRDELWNISTQIPGAYFEDKVCTASLHFRHVAISARNQLFATIKALSKKHSKTLLIQRDFEYVYTICPRNAPHKGSAAKRIMQLLPAGTVPIFIGDDIGDEAAFRALRHGITIRVGKNRPTAATYRIPAQKSVDTFLALLAALD